MIKVFGGGLLAKYFSNIEYSGNLCILASGVSDSNETRNSEFQREFDLIRLAISDYEKYKIVYFSTCSVDYALPTPYTLHKIRMEFYIKNNCNDYLIFRLPQVVGPVNNKTLISFFVRSLLQNKHVEIQKFATRNLIGINDLFRVTSHLLNEYNVAGDVINISSEFDVSVYEIYKNISETLQVPMNFSFLPTGARQIVNVSNLKNYIQSDILFDRSYWLIPLDSYVKNIADTIIMK